MYALADIYPLSPLQSLFVAVGGGEGDVGFLQFRFMLRGPLDAATYERAWRDVVAATPTLRTAFTTEGLEEPLQVVFDDVALPFELVDLRELPPDFQAHQRHSKSLLHRNRQRVLRRLCSVGSPGSQDMRTPVCHIPFAACAPKDGRAHSKLYMGGLLPVPH